uniref:Uncharacterized protein n=1 Tax=Panagrolaimus superbus TaxID=310955 RepID=A0A914YSY1_9BILA
MATSEKEYYTFHDKMEHELNKLQSTTKREIADIHPSFDFAVIADIVQSKAEKKYFVIAELKKPTVSFIPANYIRESTTFEIGQKLKIVRKCGIGLEDIQIIPNEVDDDSYFEYNWCEGVSCDMI